LTRDKFTSSPFIVETLHADMLFDLAVVALWPAGLLWCLSTLLIITSIQATTHLHYWLHTPLFTCIWVTSVNKYIFVIPNLHVAFLLRASSRFVTSGGLSGIWKVWFSLCGASHPGS
jgi:hypothetical protein